MLHQAEPSRTANIRQIQSNFITALHIDGSRLAIATLDRFISPLRRGLGVRAALTVITAFAGTPSAYGAANASAEATFLSRSLQVIGRSEPSKPTDSAREVCDARIG